MICQLYYSYNHKVVKVLLGPFLLARSIFLNLICQHFSPLWNQWIHSSVCDISYPGYLYFILTANMPAARVADNFKTWLENMAFSVACSTCYQPNFQGKVVQGVFEGLQGSDGPKIVDWSSIIDQFYGLWKQNDLLLIEQYDACVLKSSDLLCMVDNLYLMQRELNGSILDANGVRFSEYKTWIWNIGSSQLAQKPSSGTVPGQCCNARYKCRTIIHQACWEYPEWAILVHLNGVPELPEALQHFPNPFKNQHNWN